MSINAFLALLAMTILEEIAACWHPVLLVFVQVLTLVSFLALTLEPVNAYDLLVL
jgi:hypothetical protein